MKKFYPIFLLAFLTIIFFWENIFLGKVFYFGDNFNLFIPHKFFFVNEIKKGVFPLWNNLILSGTPYIADLGNFPFYPGNIFFLIFLPEKALTFLAIFQILLAGYFMYLYLKILNFNEFLRFLGTVLFMFSGSVVTHIGNISILNTIIWLPLILYFLEKTFRDRKFKYIFLTSLFLAFSFLGGHIQFFYYNFVFLGLYLIFKINSPFKQKIKYGLFLFLIFLGLSSFQLLPFLEFSNNSTRPVADFNYATEGSINPFIILRFLFAEIYGRLKDGYSWGPGAPMERGFADVTGYIGVIPIFLIFYYFLNIKKAKKNFFWLSILFISLFLSLGKYTPLYFLFFKLFPFFNRFRNPGQFLYLYTFSAVIISLYGLELFLREKLRKIKLNKALLAVLTIFFILIFGVFLKTIVEKEFLFKELTIFYEKIFNKPLIFSQAYNKEKVIIILNLFFRNFFFFILILYLAGITFFFYSKKKISLKVFQIILFLIIFFDFLLYSKNSLFIADREVFNIPDEATIFLKKNLRPYERFLSTSEIIPYTGLFNYWNQTMVREPFGESRVDKKELENFRVLKGETSILPPDLGMNFNLLTINGYSPMILKSYADFWDSERVSKNINNIYIKDFNDKKIDLTGVKYLVINKELEKEVKKIEKIKNFKLVFNGKFVKIYKNKKVYPRSFLLSNGKIIRKEILDYQPNKVVIKVKKNDHGVLVLTDNYYPGWKVFLDGKESEIKTYKKTFKSVKIKSGVKEVIFLFKPKLFYFGIVISFLTLILCLLKLAF